MRDQGKAALLMAGLAVSAVVVAPGAGARPCDQTNELTICQTNGSVSIKAVPGTYAAHATLPLIPWLTGGRRTGIGGRW